MSTAEIIAVDVGGTKTALAVVDPTSGRVRQRTEFPTPRREETGEAFQRFLAGQIDQLGQQTNSRRLGISLCELVDPSGLARSAHRVLWSNTAMEQQLPGFEITVEADIRAAAVCESRLGAGRGYRDILYVNLGTGISSCWVTQGNPYPGARGNALLLGSSRIAAIHGSSLRPDCFVVEERAGGAGLVARMREAGGQAEENARSVFEAEASGNPIAKRTLDDAVQVLGLAIGAAVNLLDPEALVLGGGLAHAGGPYGRPLEQAVRDEIWAAETRSLPILRAAFQGDSALIGAALSAAG